MIGGLTGVGGGVIIKPVLDTFGTMSVATISFLSGCTVLAMSVATLIRNRHSEIKVEKEQGTCLALGAAVGGVFGKQIFDYVQTITGNPNMLGMLQSFGLALVTFAVLILTLQKHKITPCKVTNRWMAGSIGIGLGTLSAFLGIGGGPINLAALYLFFAMDTRTAAINSVYIILFSQISSIGHTIILGNLPVFDSAVAGMMLVGGILGGILAASMSKKVSTKGLDKIYIGLIVVIVFISGVNGIRYMGAL